MNNEARGDASIDIENKLDVNLERYTTELSRSRTKDVALVGVFSAILGLLAIAAWIVPFGHITMEFLINVVVVLLLKLRRREGTLLVTGLVTGVVDFLGGLSGPGGFLSPVVYGFRFGFLEIVYRRFGKGDRRRGNGAIIAGNTAGYFLTSALIWLMYAALFLPLGDEFTQRMWFVLALAGTGICIPATVLAVKVYDRWFLPHKKAFDAAVAG
ncbi:MAG: hypothetical protein JW839_17560 [Candidatus Lokiarchaeota archaeon]|nr:hypothetical protein [Candidatus Lokiarchaeota archaeon]